MERAIKFRGKRIDNGEWVYGFYWASLDPTSVEDKWRGHFIHNGVNIQSPWKVIPESVGQFTGLKDKNGKEIFEGDRLKIKWVQQNWQTHTGDNIPFGGSYTEPDVSSIEEVNDGGYVVTFERGAFRMGGEYDMPHGCYDNLLETFLSTFWWEDVFDGMEETYFEDEGYKTLAELRESCGVWVIGNVIDNPELITK